MAHKYGEFYPELARAGEIIRDEYREEREKFQKALDKGLRALGDAKKLTGQEAFNIYQSFGLSPEIIQELKPFSKDEFDKAKREHLSVSAKGAEKKFGGHGLLLDTGELKAANEEELKKVTRLHTATHLLQAALRKVLGEEVKQAGSDITAERTRFDFTFDRKLTDEEIKKVEGLVNLAVNKKYQVKMKEMALEDALKLGALHFFKEKYPQKVKVYSIGDLKADPPEIFSRELCGGPHVKNTSEIGQFKILKQEAVGAGLRRIRATVD
ncbi:MAG: Alanine-tRNA ligase [Candidatus Giovannonibacteria bacterium GW2011_GWC2_43_8]|nr:MAG: Alanine-tRNA ligase [Candidatus Giovannonibacteria bacterium GW2011_GWC2_43_8]